MKLTEHEKIQLFDSLNDTWAEIIPMKVTRRILRLLSASDIAKRVNKSISSIEYHVRAGHVPGASVRLNKRWFWTASDVRIVEEFMTGPRKYIPRRSRHTEAEILEMKRLYASGLSQWEVARKFDVTQSMVSRIVNGRKYHSKPLVG